MGIVETAIVAAVAAWAGVGLAGVLLPFRGIFDWGIPLTAWRATPGTVALTFDDGPHPRWTPMVLDALALARVKATFFLVGQRAAEHPDLVRRMAAEGHVIGNHGWSHATLPRLGGRRLGEELDRCQEVLGRLTGTAPGLLRPPYGRRDPRVWRAARRLGLTPVMWSLDSLDWLRRDPLRLRRRLERVRSGHIVLMHDGQADASHTVDALGHLLLALQRRGIPTSTVAHRTSSCPKETS